MAEYAELLASVMHLTPDNHVININNMKHSEVFSSDQQCQYGMNFKTDTTDCPHDFKVLSCCDKFKFYKHRT